MISANLLVHYTSPTQRPSADGKLLRDLDEYLFFLGLWTDYSLYSFILPSIPEAMKILERTKATPRGGERKDRACRAESRDIRHAKGADGEEAEDLQGKRLVSWTRELPITRSNVCRAIPLEPPPVQAR